MAQIHIIDKKSRKEFLEAVRTSYSSDDLQSTFDRWGMQRCIDCPHCKFFVTNTLEIGLWSAYPRCTKFSSRGRQIRTSPDLSKTLGCLKHCPCISDDEVTARKLKHLYEKLERQSNILINTQKIIKQTLEEINVLESKNTNEH